MTEKPSAGQGLRGRALARLARREHSRRELRRKLVEQHRDAAIEVDGLLDQLEAEGLLSDHRFAEAYLHAQVRRGHGRVRIRHDLRERGIAEDAISELLHGAGVDWITLARTQIERRFGAAPAQGAALAQRMRFLHQRGFSGEEIRIALGGTST